MSLIYHAPRSTDEALSIAAQCGPAARFIAGGTDLVIQMRRKKIAPQHVIDLQHVAALRDCAFDGRQITLGALATHMEIEREARRRPELLALAESACVIGGHQVRNVGTVGGNLCNASPAADLAPILLALEADVTLASLAGTRSLPLAEFLLGPGKTARRDGELLTSVSFSAPSPRVATAFLKGGRRRAMEISIVSVACALSLNAAGQVMDVRIAVGAASPVPYRATAAESLLLSQSLGEAQLLAAGASAAAAAAPISDVRASADYRRHLVAKSVAKALRTCQIRLKEYADA